MKKLPLEYQMVTKSYLKPNFLPTYLCDSGNSSDSSDISDSRDSNDSCDSCDEEKNVDEKKMWWKKVMIKYIYEKKKNGDKKN